MSWLATWFIIELVGVGADPNLSEPQAFKTVFFLHVILWIKHSLFVVYFTKNCTTFKFSTFDMNGQSGSGTLLPLPPLRKFAVSTASASTSLYTTLHSLSGAAGLNVFLLQIPLVLLATTRNRHFTRNNVNSYMAELASA